MREQILKQFCSGDVDADTLAADVSGSVTYLDHIHSTVQIEDMREPFTLKREHVLRLCDAARAGILPSESLSATAFALMASDTFEWDDEIISEVLGDWSCPEVNYPLTTDTLAMHRSWLTSECSPPERPSAGPGNRPGRLISRTTKVRLSGDLPTRESSV
jgi:hypothetical protein